MYFKKAEEAEVRAQMVRQTVLSHEHLSKESLLQQAEESNANGNSQTIYKMPLAKLGGNL